MVSASDPGGGMRDDRSIGRIAALAIVHARK